MFWQCAIYDLRLALSLFTLIEPNERRLDDLRLTIDNIGIYWFFLKTDALIR
jgi:hypothetical protein